MHGRRRGVTLIELMIATALGIMLIGIAALIFMQSQDMFMATNARVSLAVQMRGALEQVRRDLAHTMNTGDVEFFNDANGDGHHSAGEELAGQEPLGGGCGSANVAGFSRSMTICTATYTPAFPPGSNPARCDAIYFRADPGHPQVAFVVEYRLMQAGQSTRFVRRYFEAPPTGGGSVVASTEVLLDNVVSVQFEFQDPTGNWVDATAGAALGLNSVAAASGTAVEMSFEGNGTLTGGALTVPNTPGLAALRPGAPVILSGSTQGDFTVEDLRVQGGNAVISFEQRFAASGGVAWRAPWLPPAIRARVTMLPSSSPDQTVSAEAVIRVR